MIEAIFYIIIIIFATIMLFKYEPKNIEFEIPKAFEIIENGDEN
jgi:hypothetical protein